LAFRRTERPANGGEVRIRKKSGQGYVGTTTIGIFRGLMLFGNSAALIRINAEMRPRRNILALVGDLD